MVKVTELFENWRDYQETQEANQFVQDIWEGKFLESSPIIYEANGVWHLDSRLDEGLWDFMKSVVSWGKSKYAEFEDWAESKLQKVVDAALEKLQSFLRKGREITKNAEGKMKSFLMKLFNKNQYRRIRDVLGALRQPQWLAVGATLLSMLLQKVAKMGMNRLLDAASGGSATAARVINFIRENYERFQEFMEMIMDFLDPNGLLDTIENLGIFKDSIEKFQQLKKDIRSQAFKENIMENLLETLTDEQLSEIVRESIKAISEKKKKKGGTPGQEICPAGKAWAKRKFETYPSVYANLAASKYCTDPNYAKKDKKKNETKEDFEPHMMYNPDTGEAIEAKTHQDHVELGKKGYVHEKPKVDEKKGELQNWLDKKWVRVTSSGNIAGECGTSKDTKNPDRCLPKAKAQSMSKGERAATARKKKEAQKSGKDSGKTSNVKNTKKGTVTKKHSGQ